MSLLTQRRLILLFLASSCLHASAILWTSLSANPTSLNLDGVSSINDSGVISGNLGGLIGLTSVSSSVFTSIGIPAGSSIVNSNGQVAGSYQVGPGFVSYFWSTATGTIFIPGVQNVLDFNDAGQAVGQTSASGFLRAYVWSNTAGLNLLGNPTSTYVAQVIANNGSIICSDNPPPFTLQTAVQCDTTTAITPIVSGIYWITAGNNLGWFAGWNNNGGYVYVPGTGFLSTGSFQATGMNDLGVVVGNTSGLPAYWTPAGGVQMLSTAAASNPFALGINNLNQVIGSGQTDVGAVVPEPATVSLVAAALLGAVLRRRVHS